MAPNKRSGHCLTRYASRSPAAADWYSSGLRSHHRRPVLTGTTSGTSSWMKPKTTWPAWRRSAFLDQQEEALKREAFDYLRNIATQLKQTNPTLRATIDVRVGDPAPGIVMAEVDRGADLVVMSTRGRTGIGRAVMGSVAGE